MSNRSTKTNIKTGGEGSRSKKLILIGGLVSLGIIILSVGLVFGLKESDSSSNNTKQTKEPEIPGVIKETKSYIVNEEVDSDEPTKKIKTLRVHEGKTFSTVKAELDFNNFDFEAVDFIQIPFSYRKDAYEDLSESFKTDWRKRNEAYKLIKVRLGLKDSFENSKIGFVLYESEYEDSTNYSSSDLVEVNIPTSTRIISESKFEYNKIKKFNLDELTKLETIETRAFKNNLLEGALDLSNLTKLKTIGELVFSNNFFKGQLILPPNIELIKGYAFNDSLDEGYGSNGILTSHNKFSGEVKIPSSLKQIEIFAFVYNNFTKIDWTNAKNLETIGPAAFFYAKIDGSDLIKNFPPKLRTIGQNAFQNAKGKAISSDITLPSVLTTIGEKAFDVADNITITVSANAKSISSSSFNGKNITVIKATA